MDIDQGVCHQVLADKGWVHPGEIVVVTDSHTTTHGAFGAFGTGVGATDLATIMITGKLWFMVPEIFRINLVGKLQPGVFAKDIILHIIGDLGADYGVYKAVEFAGPVVNGLSISERMCMCICQRRWVVKPAISSLMLSLWNICTTVWQDLIKFMKQILIFNMLRSLRMT